MEVKHFLKVTDLNKGQINDVLLYSNQFRRKHLKWKFNNEILAKLPIHAYFAKDSNRTTTSIETAITQLGWTPIIRKWQTVLPWEDWKSRESAEYIARGAQALYAKMVFARVFDHNTLIQMTGAWSVFSKENQPIIVNALCDKHHPLQALADMMTIQKFSDQFQEKIKVAFVGDWNNVANSLWQICATLWVDFSIACPPDYQLWAHDKSIIINLARETWSNVEFLDNPINAVKNAQFVNTDTFISMWEEGIALEKIKAFKWYQVNEDLMSKASDWAFFMHCLPAYEWKEVTKWVINHPTKSLIWEQSRARVDTVKALIPILLRLNDVI